MVITRPSGSRSGRVGCDVFRVQIRDHRYQHLGRPERSDPLTVGRPPASWLLHRRSSAAELGGLGGPGRSAVKGGPGTAETGSGPIEGGWRGDEVLIPPILSPYGAPPRSYAAGVGEDRARGDLGLAGGSEGSAMGRDRGPDHAGLEGDPPRSA